MAKRKLPAEFTHIAPRSLKAYVGRRRRTIDAVMAALAVEPLEAEDAYKQFGVQGTPHSLAYFASRDIESRGGYTAALQTISEWIGGESKADWALNQLCHYDRRLGAWCCLAMASHVVSSIGMTDTFVDGPIAEARSYVLGKSKRDALLKAIDQHIAAQDRSLSLSERIVNSMSCVFWSVSSVTAYADRDAGNRAALAFDWAAATLLTKFPLLMNGERPYYEPEVKYELRSVIAEACLSYPVTP